MNRPKAQASIPRVYAGEFELVLTCPRCRADGARWRPQPFGVFMASCPACLVGSETEVGLQIEKRPVA